MSNKKKKLTKRDLDIMEILWKHEEPIAASEIQKERFPAECRRAPVSKRQRQGKRGKSGQKARDLFCFPLCQSV